MSDLKQRLVAWLNLHPDEATKNSLHDLWFGCAIKSSLQRDFGDHHFGMAVDEITRLTALVAKYEAELHTYRDSLTKLESDNFCLIEQLNHAIAFGDAEKSAKIAKYEAAIDEHKEVVTAYCKETPMDDADFKLWQTRGKV